MRRIDYPFEPMSSGNIRANGVHSPDVSRWECHHRAILSAEPWPDDVPVPTLGPRIVCTQCGIVGCRRASRTGHRILSFAAAVGAPRPGLPLRRRMIEDMTVRKFTLKTQSDYIRVAKNFTIFVSGPRPACFSFRCSWNRPNPHWKRCQRDRHLRQRERLRFQLRRPRPCRSRCRRTRRPLASAGSGSLAVVIRFTRTTIKETRCTKMRGGSCVILDPIAAQGAYSRILASSALGLKGFAT